MFHQQTVTKHCSNKKLTISLQSAKIHTILTPEHQSSQDYH